MKKGETNEILERIMLVALAALFCFIVGFQITFAEIYKRTDEKETIPFAENCRTAFEEYSQNPSTEWERLTNPTFPLGVINWDLVTNQSASDKSMDKMIVGTVKNNSEREFFEVKIEFTIYDEKGNQIAIVGRSFNNFKPQKIWKFEIPVTHDVEKAKFRGLYVPSKEVKGIEEQRSHHQVEGDKK